MKTTNRITMKKVYIVTSDLVIDYKTYPEYNFPTMAFTSRKKADEEFSRRYWDIKKAFPNIDMEWLFINIEYGLEYFEGYKSRIGNHFRLETIELELH